ncbi:MAG: hypothetical protein WD904_14630 [Dehalococcoidia bacterium]
MTVLTPADATRARAGAFAGLACAGLWVTAFGPALSFFARDFDVSLGVAGLVVTGLAGGSISASAFVSLRLGRADGRLLTALGLVIASLGLLLLAVSPSLPAAVGASVFIGLGDGLVVAATHSLVAAVSREPAQGINPAEPVFRVGRDRRAVLHGRVARGYRGRDGGLCRARRRGGAGGGVRLA